MWGILVALLSGALDELQGIFNTEVTKQSSIWAAARMGAADGVSDMCGSLFFTGVGRSGGCSPSTGNICFSAVSWARSSPGP